MEGLISEQPLYIFKTILVNIVYLIFIAELDEEYVRRRQICLQQMFELEKQYMELHDMYALKVKMFKFIWHS